MAGRRLDLFQRTPSRGWAAVPLTSEFSLDDRTTGRLRDELETHLLTTARREFADAVTLDGGKGLLALSDLAYEVPELSDLLARADVCQISGRKGAVAASARSPDDRWRRVLDDLRDLDAKTPQLVDAASALQLLDDMDRPAEFVADLVGIAVTSNLASELTEYPCLVLEDGCAPPPKNGVTSMSCSLRTAAPCGRS